ncbi:MAG: phosphotransferase [Nanoarchaeota archaeon]|jgi:fructosamine-3-kinase|nr:phosphotransferase [Nanoarchaeota archaeon]
MIGFEERISKILGIVPTKISKLKNLKSSSYIVDTFDHKYFFKFSKQKKVEKEKYGIKYFKDNLDIETPKIIFEGPDYLVTKFEEDLRRVHPTDLVNIVAHYQKRYIESSTPALIPTKFSRQKINQLYERNKKHFVGFQTKGLSKILNIIGEKAYKELPKVISHGDVHNKNIFLTKNNNPFILDFENLSTDYPTFDISTAIFYALNDAKGIINNYSSNIPQNFNISKNNLIDLVIADTLRIAIYDTLNSKKRNEKTLDIEKRIRNNKKFFDVFL